jgi:hypothetical protein
MCLSLTSGAPTRAAISRPTVSLVVVLSLAGMSWRSIPTRFIDRSDKQICSTLVHEQCHVSQHQQNAGGKPDLAIRCDHRDRKMKVSA